LLRLLASICTPCRSKGWLGARAPRVAMTTTIAPPLTEVLNRTLSATWLHMFLYQLAASIPLLQPRAGGIATLGNSSKSRASLSLLCVDTE
jgi:hypothetical protein